MVATKNHINKNKLDKNNNHKKASKKQLLHQNPKTHTHSGEKYHKASR